MNIGYDAKRAFFNKSGLGNYSRSTLSILEEHYPMNDYYLYTPKSNIELFDITEKKLILKTKRDCSATLPNVLWRSYGISKCIKNDNIDIFHGLSNELPLNIKSTKIKSIVTIHDLIFLKYPNLYKLIDRRIYNYKFRKSTQNSDLIIAVSEQTKQDIVDLYKINENKIKVVYQTCNNAFKTKYKETEKDEVKNKFFLPKNYILYVGTIEERKNLLSVIKAVHNLSIDIQIVAVGKKTSYFNEIEEYLIQNNISNVLQVLSNVSNSELAMIYQMSEMLVYPSSYEGFGIPIIEAMFSEIPVITTKGGCFAETGGEAAIYIKPNDIDEIANAINKLLADKQFKEECIAKGNEHMKNFDNKIIADKLMEVYLNLIQK